MLPIRYTRLLAMLLRVRETSFNQLIYSLSLLLLVACPVRHMPTVLYNPHSRLWQQAVVFLRMVVVYLQQEGGYSLQGDTKKLVRSVHLI